MGDFNETIYLLGLTFLGLAFSVYISNKRKK
jgi:LPXTG-motif cell wall-anchored protein